MGEDFPAAHSMDTVWFAIDKDGHVASFWSGESGAVPVGAVTEAALDEGAWDWEGILESLPPCDGVIDPLGRALPSRRSTRGRHIAGGDIGFAVLMFLDALASVEEHVAAGHAQAHSTTSGAAVVWQTLTQETWERLHRAGVCRGCEFYLVGLGVWPEDLARRGIYLYRHLTENWISGPYGRFLVPSQPLHVDQFPPAIRRVLKLTRFEELRFTDAAHIQPVEHGDCESWEAAYIDVTGKHIRPVPGHEGDYLLRFPTLKDMKAEFDIEQPPAEAEGPEE
jgi:hypothetical protein